MIEHHLGDATYAKWDGEAITLRKDSGFEGADPEIALTPNLMNELVLFIEDTFNLRITVGSKSGGEPIDTLMIEARCAAGAALKETGE